MNPGNGEVAASAVAFAPPPQPPQPQRSSTSCDRHPDERFTGFCPCCLFERLSVLELSNKDTAASSTSSSSRKPPLSAAAIKAIFKHSSSGNAAAAAAGSSQQVRPGLFPELRRTKSFSSTKNEGFSGAFEPQRRSCDVRDRNTLWSLFSEDDERKKSGRTTGEGAGSSSGGGGGGGEFEVPRRNSSVRSPVFEEETVSESEHEEKNDNTESANENGNVGEIVEEEVEKREAEAREEEPKKVKEHMDFNPQAKKTNRDFKDIAGSFWSAASVFGKKVQKWRQKQKVKKHRNGGDRGSAALPVEKPIGKQFRDTQSEIADYGYGRRSCDTDPRFSIDAGRFSLDAGRISLDAGRISLDAGRVSVDDPRYSFDEPRASWDGYLIGRTNAPPRMPSMLSVVEDSPIRNHVLRSDTQIPVEEPPPPPPLEMDENAPGGSAQTRDYYSDSSSRRRKSLDHSGSIRKTSASIVAEVDEQKPISNPKVSAFQDRDSKDSHSYSHSNSLRDDCSAENFEMGFQGSAGNADNKKGTKKSRRWSWNIFGLIHKRGGSKYEEEEEEEEEDFDDDERLSSGGRNGVERSFSGSWNGERRKGFDPRMMRSNSSVSWRSSRSFNGGGGGGSQRKSNADGYNSGKKKVEGNKIENGMLRFYLAPMRGSRRGSNGRANPVPVHPMARSMMKLY